MEYDLEFFLLEYEDIFSVAELELWPIQCYLMMYRQKRLTLNTFIWLRIHVYYIINWRPEANFEHTCVQSYPAEYSCAFLSEIESLY